MAIGLGQMLIGGLIGSQLGKGGLLGSDDEDKTIKSMGEYNQPQAQPQAQSQGGGVFGGIGNMVSGISNQLFDGMSQEQVARLGNLILQTHNRWLCKINKTTCKVN